MVRSDATLPLAEVTLAAPLLRPGKIVAVGRNYREHCDEQSAEVPTRPLLFLKPSTSIVGPGAPIRWPDAVTQAVDLEAELAVVIGKRAHRVPREAALDHVFGYTCLNDVSARDLQRADKQWTRAKGLDTFCPLGPWIVTADEIPDPQRLAITSRLNGEAMQQASTAQMIFPIDVLIEHVTQGMTLEPGDVLATGTPSGVGAFRDPPRFLRTGDVVEIEIEGIGTLTNPVAGPY